MQASRSPARGGDGDSYASNPIPRTTTGRRPTGSTAATSFAAATAAGSMSRSLPISTSSQLSSRRDPRATRLLRIATWRARPTPASPPCSWSISRICPPMNAISTSSPSSRARTCRCFGCPPAAARALRISRSALTGRRTLFAGQSGVGKSSLFNTLCGSDVRATRTLSDASGEGRHTTVSSAILTLPWGELVDTPGVRDYAPPLVPQRTVQEGYAEITRLAGSCRFQDCLHQREPACAVRNAVAAGDVSERRYESYRRLLNLMRQLTSRRGWRT